MNETVCVMRHPRVEKPAECGWVRLFAKWFPVQATQTATVRVHEDYPNITEDDIREFIRFCEGKTSPVVSGCRAEIHPYRLLYVTPEGFFKPYAVVPKDIRGNRHLYPEVYRAVPALIYFPPGMSPEIFDSGVLPHIYAMEKEKLLDKTRFPDRLFL